MSAIQRAPSQLVHKNINWSTLSDKLEWEVLFAPATDPHADLGYIVGQQVRDNISETTVELVETSGGYFWRGVNCTLLTYTASAPVSANAYLTIAGANTCAETGAGLATHAISLNGADTSERVYAMLVGAFYVRAGGAPPAIGGGSSSAALGRTKAVATTELYAGFNTRATITVGGIAYNLVTISGLVVAAP